MKRSLTAFYLAATVVLLATGLPDSPEVVPESLLKTDQIIPEDIVPEKDEDNSKEIDADELLEIFHKKDEDNSKEIDADELGKESLLHTPELKAKMIQDFDKDHSGTLSYPEFEALYKDARLKLYNNQPPTDSTKKVDMKLLQAYVMSDKSKPFDMSKFVQTEADIIDKPEKNRTDKPGGAFICRFPQTTWGSKGNGGGGMVYQHVWYNRGCTALGFINCRCEYKGFWLCTHRASRVYAIPVTTSGQEKQRYCGSGDAYSKNNKPTYGGIEDEAINCGTPSDTHEAGCHGK